MKNSAAGTASTQLCECTNPFCGEDHAPYVPTPIGANEEIPDDWEGPQGPEYSEYDEETWSEMVRQDMEEMS